MFSLSRTHTRCFETALIPFDLEAQTSLSERSRDAASSLENTVEVVTSVY